MSRIAATFAQLQKTGRKALIPYITAGDPNPTMTVPLMHGLVAAGADLIELGMPFSEPMAEGPVIQAAHERALAQGVKLADVLNMVIEFRQQNKLTPVVLMGYLNPIEQMGYQKFAEMAANVGVDGLLIVDLPPEEGNELWQVLKERQIDPIFLIAPTTTRIRIKNICEQATGYHYYVSFKGVTGKGDLDIAAITAKLAEIRCHAHLPVGVGFGIRDAQTAAAIAAIADAVIVGSTLVARIAASVDNLAKIQQDVCALLQEMRIAIDGGK